MPTDSRANDAPPSSASGAPPVYKLGDLYREAFARGLPFGDRAGRDGAPFVDFVLEAAAAKNFDPALIFAIMWRESAWGYYLSPRGPGGTGDGGHGRGLMQIDDRSHQAYLAQGTWQEPRSNILYGAGVLRSSVDFFNGRGLDPAAQLAAGIAGYNAGPGRVWNAVKNGASPDSVTTGKDYSAYVLSKAAAINAAIDRVARERG